MKMKKLVSAIAALAMSVSAFAGIASADTVKWAPTADDLAALTDWTVTSDGTWVTPSGYANRASAAAALPTAVTDEIVQIKFDTKHAAFGGGVSFQDSNGNEIVKAHFDNSSWAFTINGVTPNIGFGRGNVVDVDLTVNMTTKTIVSGTVTNETNGTVDSTSLAGVAFTSASAADIGKIGMNPRGGNYNMNGNVSVANVSLTALTVSTAAYTINYTLDDTVVKTTTEEAIVGQIVNAETVVYDEAGAKYFAEAASLEVTADAAANVLNVPVRVADSYNVTIDAVGAIEQNLFTGTALEGDDYSYSYPAYLTDADGNYYKAEGTAYGETVPAISAAIDKDVTYTLAEGIVAVIEAEDFVKAGSVAECSNGAYGNMAATNSVGSQVTAVTLPAGIYKIDVAYYNDGAGHGNRGFYVRDKAIEDNEANVVSSVEIDRYAASGIYSAEMTLTEETTLTLTGYTNGTKTNQSVFFDYVVITKTGDYEAPAPEKTLPEVAVSEFGTFTENAENPAKAYLGTFTVDAEANYAVSAVLWTVGEASATSTFDTTISGGTVVTGLVITAADLTTIPEVVATAVAAE